MGKKKRKKKGYGNKIWDKVLREEKPSTFMTTWREKVLDEVRWLRPGP